MTKQPTNTKVIPMKMVTGRGILAMAVGLAWLASTQAGTLQWGTAFSGTSPNFNSTAPTSGNWSEANWTFRSGTDLGVAGVPDAGDTAQIGFLDATTTVTVDGTFALAKLDVRPRTSGFSARTLTINSSSGLLQVGSGGVSIDNGAAVSVNVPIELTSDQTFAGGSNNPGGAAKFTAAVSGSFKITRTSSNYSPFEFSAAANTFLGFRQASANVLTRIGSSSAATASGGGPLGGGLLELAAGTLSANSSTGRTLKNSVQIEGNITFGQTDTAAWPFSGGTGTLTFDTGWEDATFNLYSTTDGAVRTLTTVRNVVVNHGIGETGGGTGLGLVKKGTATLTLGGSAANTFGGGLVVSNGTVAATKGAACGTGNVTVAEESGTSTAKLTVNAGVTSAIADTAKLTLVSNAGNYPTVELGAGVVEVVKALVLDGASQAQGMTYGATGSGATVVSDSWFAGSGVVKVAAPTGTLITLR